MKTLTVVLLLSCLVFAEKKPKQDFNPADWPLNVEIRASDTGTSTAQGTVYQAVVQVNGTAYSVYCIRGVFGGSCLQLYSGRVLPGRFRHDRWAGDEIQVFYRDNKGKGKVLTYIPTAEAAQ